MRFDTINASGYLVWQLEHASGVTHIRDEGDILLLDLRSDARVMIMLVERSMSVADVRWQLTTNTKKGIYTLLIFWVDMLLPSDGSEYVLDDWMQGLSQLYGNLLYGYEVAGRQAYFFPVHFDGNGASRQVRFGNTVDYAKLGVKTVACEHPFLRGQWRIAHFANERPYTYARSQQSHAHAGTSSLSVSDLSPYFTRLGISASADRDAVKQAYRTLARQYHPDLNTADDALSHMKRINEAYHHLMRFFEKTSTG